MRNSFSLFVLAILSSGCLEYHLRPIREKAENTETAEDDKVDDSNESVDTGYLPEEETGTEVVDTEEPEDTNIEEPCVPTGDEYCDGIDNDCDGLTDEGDAIDATIWYADTDMDTYGNAANFVTACAPPLGYVTDATDCDDSHNTVHPGAEEICDWILDNNCDGTPDTREWDGDYDANGDGDYDDAGEVTQYGGADGYTVCFPYFIQIDDDSDGYCQSGMDLNNDGDCTDTEDILYARDQECPSEYIDCEVTDPDVYPGHGC